MARRDSNAGSAGPISTFFASVLGINSVNVSTIATAALTGQSKAGPGGLPLPVGISKYFFDQGCLDNKAIRFSPTGGDKTYDELYGKSCGGWHSYTDTKTSDSGLREILEGLNNGTFQSPETFAGETRFNFIGGNLSEQTFEAMETLFNTMRIKNDGVYDNDTDPNTWTTTVPVYDSTNCKNPNQSLTIVGFAEVTITDVLGAPDKIIKGTIKCDYVDEGHGGGGNYGTKGSIPGLVQ